MSFTVSLVNGDSSFRLGSKNNVSFFFLPRLGIKERRAQKVRMRIILHWVKMIHSCAKLTWLCGLEGQSDFHSCLINVSNFWWLKFCDKLMSLSALYLRIILTHLFAFCFVFKVRLRDFLARYPTTQTAPISE